MKKKQKTIKVGFCQPPKKHQFKKGVSGNPSGRKSRSMYGDPALGVAQILADITRNVRRAKNGRDGNTVIVRQLAATLIASAMKKNNDARKRLWMLMPQVEAILRRRQEARNKEESRLKDIVFADWIAEMKHFEKEIHNNNLRERMNK